MATTSIALYHSHIRRPESIGRLYLGFNYDALRGVKQTGGLLGYFRDWIVLLGRSISITRHT